MKYSGYEDLGFLNKELWSLPHIRVLALFPLSELRLTAKAVEQIKSILHSHPQIRELVIPPASGINAELFTDKLRANSPEGLDREAWFNFLLSWLERKAVHAIIGNRVEELEALFGDKVFFSRHLTKLIESHGIAVNDLKKQDKKVEDDYKRIKELNDANKYPLPKYRQPEDKDTQWLVNSDIKFYLEQWKAYFLSFSQDLSSRQEEYRSLSYDPVVRAERIKQLSFYIQERLGVRWAQYFANQADILTPFDAGHNFLSKILLLNSNQVLVSFYDAQFIASFPLSLAFRHRKLDVFKKLLELGANPFISEDFFKEVLDSKDSGQKYLLAMVDYFKSLKVDEEVRDKYELEKRRLEFSLPVEKVQEYSAATLEALNKVYSILFDYMVDGFRERLKPSPNISSKP